jgi:hypothetical protein
LHGSQIANTDAKDPVFMRVLGWSEPVAAVVAAAQLTALQEHYTELTASGNDAVATELKKALATVVPSIYSLLNKVST